MSGMGMKPLMPDELVDQALRFERQFPNDQSVLSDKHPAMSVKGIRQRNPSA